MMCKQRVKIVLGLMLSLMLCASIVAAEQNAAHCLPNNNALDYSLKINVDALAAQLKLSAEQLNKLHGIIDDVSTPMFAMQEKLLANQEMLKKTQALNPPDAAAIKTIADKQAKLFADMLQLRNKIHSDIDSVLTPEQREQLRLAH